MGRASDIAYDTIRAMIVSGEVAAGEQLGEEALAERAGVSRTPVRDALRRLEAEMLVRRNESQRCFVSEWSLAEIEHLFELRAMLEGHAAARAATRISAAQLAHLAEFNTLIKRAIMSTSPDIDAFLEGNKAFHATVLEAAGSPRLSALLGSLIEQPVIWRTARHYGQAELHRSHAEHEELIAALSRADAAWAEALMRAHIHRAGHAYADAHRGPAAGEGLAEAAE